MSKPNRITELPLTTNPLISDLLPLARPGSNSRVTIGTVLNSNFPVNFGDTIIDGDLTVNGTETIISSSVLYDSGSTIFGNSSDDIHDFIGDTTISGSLFVSGTTELGGNIIPKTARGATLGTFEKPFSEIFVSSGSINIASDTPGDPNTSISNIGGNLLISAGGVRLLGSSSFIATTGSFQYLSSSFTHDGTAYRFGDTIVTGSVDITGDYTIYGNSFSSSLYESSSISGSVIEFTKGDTTIQQVKLPPGLGYSGLGWARYDDTTYTTSSAYSVGSSTTAILPCNGSGSIETHMHSTVPFYNPANQKIQAENDGDVYSVTIDFNMRAASNPAVDSYVRINLNNTTGTPYTRVGRDLFFQKNSTDWHSYHEIFQYYSDTDFVENGNVFNIVTNGIGVEIADVIIFIQRTQNHSQH